MYKNHTFILLISIFFITFLFAGCSENKENLNKKYTLSKETYIKLRKAKGLSNDENIIRQETVTTKKETEHNKNFSKIEDNTNDNTEYTDAKDTSDNTEYAVAKDINDNTEYTDAEDNRILTIKEANFSLEEKEKIYFIYSIFKFIKIKYHKEKEFNDMSRFLLVIDLNLDLFQNNKKEEINDFTDKLETLSSYGVDVTKFINQKLISLKNELLEFNNQNKDYNDLLSFI